MKFTPILRTIITEQTRVEVLYNALTEPRKDKEGKKLKPLLTKDEFVTLVGADPNTKLNDVDIQNANTAELSKVKAGKYVQWLIKNYLNPQTETQAGEHGHNREVAQLKERFIEDLYKVTDDLKKFERFKSKIKGERDINKLTPRQLYDTVKDFDLTVATTTKAERKQAPVHPGAKIIYDGNNWRVIEIEDKGELGKEAACFYGGNNQETRWCTSAPGGSQFERHINQGPLYVVFNPNDTNVSPTTGLPVHRWQFHFPTNQFMDYHDNPIDLVNMLNTDMSELKYVFKPEFAKGLTIGGGTKFVVDSFTHGAIGKFIALYGLDDLISSLPDTLKEFQISNKDSNKNVNITIPDEISRFKNLEMIGLDNVVSSIPDSICNIKSLRFLGLMNNQNLKTVPDCLGDLPNFLFLNTNGSPNFKLPKKLEEIANVLGDDLWDFNKGNSIV